MNNTIELKNIVKNYISKKKIKVLNKINFSFKSGKIYSLMGPSGSGKSTLLNLLPKAKTYYFTKSNNDRSLNPEILKTKFNKEGSVVYADYKEAFEEVKKVAKEKDLILVTGSAFLIGDILNEFF